ncbi:MFS transporter [Ktedonosporobacter rubrisoli]|uniref:MFS transporter n=1 Tax=Ktedonosporobacter rubrisoli TaxID=2509675 RepID=A0A4P6K3Z6_KTERU|nr:MFS transporter [Ktedonosporobacter rubrisoli]QBD82775.1 MFS transporter [Ktedonosporobacter rubrisoli]
MGRRTRTAPYYGWVLMVVLGITTIISYGTTQYLFGVLVVPISSSLHWSRASVSGTYAVGLIVAGVLGVPIGPLLDRFGARVLMSSGSALAGLSLIGLAQMQTLWQFYVLWSGGLGLAMALTLYPVTFTVVANWFVRKRGAALAVLTLVGGLSSPICIPLSGTLVAHIGWRATLVVLGLAQLVLALPLHALLLRRHPEDVGLSPDGEPASVAPATMGLPGTSLQEAVSSPTFWMLTASLSFVMLGSTVVFVHQVAFMISRGYDPVLAATLSGMLGLVSLPGRYVFNMLSSRISTQSLLLLSVVAQAVGMAVLVLSSSLLWLVLYVIMYGTAYGAFSPLRASVMADHFGRRAYGSITAVQGVPVAVCAALGPIAAGWLYDSLHHYELAFWICAGAFLLAALGLLLTTQPHYEHGRFAQMSAERHEEVTGNREE